jgi:hypothetical protein
VGLGIFSYLLLISVQVSTPASSDARILEELRTSGAKEIFKKPCSLDDLKALIERHRHNS